MIPASYKKKGKFACEMLTGVFSGPLFAYLDINNENMQPKRAKMTYLCI